MQKTLLLCVDLIAMAPSLPQPWELRMDANGYDIYWNPETKVAQYERPTYPPPPRNFAQVSLSSHPHIYMLAC